ncbi:type II toxin-antitoxin system PemK/MazF family toxin [Caulobacter sp. 73W]|uniref:Type II toxin-antitoxin system PemK/MazF family toxin n=1 Tax=Caulobacter sp. 73W TaxID=3161137 RepID=A0AB39KUP1_9CAUL
MQTFERGDLIKVPFPYTDRATRQRRPAFVIGAGDLQSGHGLLWVLMVTSAENRSWPGDVDIHDHRAAGLPAPSVVRTAKIATIDARDAEPLGKAPTALLSAVTARVETVLNGR